MKTRFVITTTYALCRLSPQNHNARHLMTLKVIEKAKSNNMPNDTIERGIKKAAGDTGNVNYEYVTYEKI